MVKRNKRCYLRTPPVALLLLLVLTEGTGTGHIWATASESSRRKNVLFFAVDGTLRGVRASRALIARSPSSINLCLLWSLSKMIIRGTGVQTSGPSSMRSIPTSPFRAQPTQRCTLRISMPWRDSLWCFARIIVSKQYVAPREPRCSHLAAQTAPECGTCPVSTIQS